MYVRLVSEVEGWTIERVPEKYREEVENKLQGGN